MAVKIRNAKITHECTSCKGNPKRLIEIGVGKTHQMTLITLCDTCAHELLQKLIVVGKEHNEVQ